MDGSPERMIGCRLVPISQWSPLVDNKPDPADQDSHTLFSAGAAEAVTRVDVRVINSSADQINPQSACRWMTIGASQTDQACANQGGR
jgi:hypothetical protein